MSQFEHLVDWDIPGGVTRLGCIAPEVRTYRVMAKLPDIPDSELREFDLRQNPYFPVKVKNQGNKGACNGHAAASSGEIARFLAGLGYVPLSAWLIYADLCRGIDRGSVIADALQHLEQKGTCEESLVPYGTIQPGQISATARENAKRFRIEIGFEINSHRDLVIATHLRMPSNFSVPVNSNFNTLDADGVPGNRSGAHNHAVCGGLGLRKSAKYGWTVLTQNSWGQQWGDKGYFFAAEKTVQGSYPDAYAVSAVIYDPEDDAVITA